MLPFIQRATSWAALSRRPVRRALAAFAVLFLVLLVAFVDDRSRQSSGLEPFYVGWSAEVLAVRPEPNAGLYRVTYRFAFVGRDYLNTASMGGPAANL
jgi:hypothetical protein